MGPRYVAAISLAALLGACIHTPPAVVSAPDVAHSAASGTGATAGDSAIHHPAEVVPAPGRFYRGLPYGSESQFNPLLLIVDGGYDDLRVLYDRNVFDLPYALPAHVVWHSVTHADAAVRHYGVRRWLTHEVFPLSLKKHGGGQWYPNYQLHLFAGGMTYVRTTEWYEQHGVSHPRLAAGATMYVWHFLVETVENGNFCCESVDALSDLLIFDSGSILLWNQSWMVKPFGGRVEFTNWPGQPTLTLPGNQLQDTYNLAMLRVPLPRTDAWKAMTTMGSSFLVGVSRRVNDEYWFSFAGGFDPIDNPVLDPVTGAKGATLKPNAGMFLDRNGSLLISMVRETGTTNGLTVNFYPGIVRFGSVRSPGAWVQRVSDGGHGWRLGVTSGIGFGLGTTRPR